MKSTSNLFSTGVGTSKAIRERRKLLRGPLRWAATWIMVKHEPSRLSQNSRTVMRLCLLCLQNFSRWKIVLDGCSTQAGLMVTLPGIRYVDALSARSRNRKFSSQSRNESFSQASRLTHTEPRDDVVGVRRRLCDRPWCRKLYETFSTSRRQYEPSASLPMLDGAERAGVGDPDRRLHWRCCDENTGRIHIGIV